MTDLKQRPRDKWGGLRRYIGFVLIFVGLSCGNAVAAIADGPALKHYTLDIPSSRIDVALFALARETGKSLIIPSGDTATERSQALSGTYTLTEALSIMLRDTTLAGGLTENGVIVISFNEAKGRGQATEQGREENTMNNSKLKKSLLASVASFLFGAGGAHAQDNATNSSAFDLDEIVVTATRRESSVQSTALSISAFGGKSLEEKGYNSIGQFIDTVPGVTANDEGGGSNRIIIRNINTSTQESGSSSVATYFDDFALTTTSFSTAADIRLVDVSRVEVLKGPQGTLFGRSAMGGIVRYISNKPDTEAFAGGLNTYLSDTADGGSNYGGHGYLNIPVAENLAVRMTGYYYDNAGFIDNVELGIDDINEEKTWGGRLAAHWDVTDTFSADFTYLYQSQNAGPNSVTTTRTPGDLNIAGDEGPDVPFDLNARTAIGGVVEERDNTYEFFNLKLEKDFEGFTTTFLATRNKLKFDFTFDQREFVGFRSGCACDIPADGNPSQDTETDILELRFVSSSDGFFDWIFGLYYEDEETAIKQFNIYKGPDQILFGLIPFTDGDVALDSIDAMNGEEQAVYGELGLNFTAATKFTVGYRRSHVEFDRLGIKADGIFNAFNGAGALVGLPFDTSENVNTFKFSLEHQLNDDVFAYATATSGYRRGGFNLPTAISEFSTFDSDTLWNYELGIKSTWLNGRLIANLSAYLIDYTDIQLTVQDPITFGRTTQNVGKAQVTGLEFSMVFQASEALNLSFNGALSNPKLKEDVPGGVSGKNGDRLPGSAKESFAITADWARPLNDELSLYSIVTYKYVGERLNDFNLDLDVALPSYGLVDARIGLRSVDGYSISLFANNLFDEKVLYGIDRQGPFFEAASTNRPRTIGLNLAYDF
ncbi:TonB-dependent receptor domain-containing protein [Kordiimonas sp.]|uniref:TonB-dependent receptor domain-containing protein n=1 Tax=Kordiimonas sp. TaxID=1970157 RepID=UPI003A936E08